MIRGRGPAGKPVGTGGAGLPKGGNKANRTGVVERSQSECRNGVPARIFHHLQCSVRGNGIWPNLLILFVELVVNEKESAGLRGGRKGEEMAVRGRACSHRGLRFPLNGT